MTEEEWLKWIYPLRMTAFVQRCFAPKAKQLRRKLRLLSCACCRRIWRHLPSDQFRHAIEVAEKHADGLAIKGELEAARRQLEALSLPVNNATRAAIAATHRLAGSTLDACLRAAAVVCAKEVPRRSPPIAAMDDEYMIQCGLVRDIFGNPFRPVQFDPSWRSADAVELARAIYEGRAFERLPILADALLDAGCASDDLLAHCRSEGPHVRGCWAVDLVLGKE